MPPLAFGRFNSIARTHLKMERKRLTVPALASRGHFELNVLLA
jgi:hypothetical protein